MKIIVNGTPLLAPLTGIGQYIRYLFSAIEHCDEADVWMYYGSRFQKGVQLPSAQAAQAVQRSYGWLRRFVPRPRSLRKVAESALFAFHTRGEPGNVIYHEPNYVALPYSGPLVLTICDMSCFDHPETHPQERVKLIQRDMPGSIDRADAIVVISQASKDALLRWFPVDPDRITVTHLAADPRFQPQAAIALKGPLERFDLTAQNYVLCVGTLEPRKNLATLFAAYAGLPAALRQRYPLVVAGMHGWNTQGLMQSANELLQRGELRLLGYVADDEMPALYAGAAAFCYPSIYEGFGLPALEAMASGVPVVTGNLTSLPEVVGEAGIMVDPHDVTGMREALRRLLEDRKFAQELGQRGLTRAQGFSWDRCAHETMAVYHKVLQARGAYA